MAITVPAAKVPGVFEGFVFHVAVLCVLSVGSEVPGGRNGEERGRHSNEGNQSELHDGARRCSCEWDYFPNGKVIEVLMCLKSNGTVRSMTISLNRYV